MFRIGSFTAWLIACGLSPASVTAMDQQGNYAIWGVGATSCHQFTRAVEQSQEDTYRHYLMGYLTAFNATSDGVHDGTHGMKLSDALRKIGSHCDLHRMDSFERAIKILLVDQARSHEQAGAPSRWGRDPKQQIK